MSSYRGFRTPIIPTGAMTGTTTITSQAFDASSLEGLAFQPSWAGTPTGAFIVEVSLDYEPNPSGGTPRNAGTWDTLVGASFPVSPAGSSGHTYAAIFASCTGYIRLSYTNSSGVGVLAGMFSGKTMG